MSSLCSLLYAICYSLSLRKFSTNSFLLLVFINFFVGLLCQTLIIVIISKYLDAKHLILRK